ncbi:MAG: hypothetical protein HY767_00120, partial [Candidatus Omnitrophica bacterium]|nr:hypothetical protein [Candidatus Omnitrophota bacterium]
MDLKPGGPRRGACGDPVLQWSVASDPNLSYTLSVKDDLAAGWHSALFCYSKRVSREYVAEQYKNLPESDSRKAALAAAILKADVFYMSPGDRGPTFQWTDSKNRNLSYSLSLDEKFPVAGGFQVPPVVTFATNVRVHMEEALAAFDLIQDLAKRAEAKEKVSAQVPVYRSLSDGISAIDGVDLVYQFADAADSDTSYTVSLKSGVPVGDPAANTGADATFGISTRVSRTEIERWLADQALVLVAQGVTSAEALANAEVFYLSKGSVSEAGQYQWTDFKGPSKSFTLAVRSDLGQKTLSLTTQVSAATVAAELAAAVAAGTIMDSDSRKKKIEDAIADGLVFYKTLGVKGPNYRWSSD